MNTNAYRTPEAPSFDEHAFDQVLCSLAQNQTRSYVAQVYDVGFLEEVSRRLLEFATHPAITPLAYKRLFTVMGTKPWGLDVSAILGALAANPNLPLEYLPLLVGTHADAVARNPVLSVLTLENPGWFQQILGGGQRRSLLAAAFAAGTDAVLQGVPSQYSFFKARAKRRHLSNDPQYPLWLYFYASGHVVSVWGPGQRDNCRVHDRLYNFYETQWHCPGPSKQMLLSYSDQGAA